MNPALLDALTGAGNQVVGGTSFGPNQQSALRSLLPRTGVGIGAAPAGAAVVPGPAPAAQTPGLTPVDLLLEQQRQAGIGSFAPPAQR